MKHLKNLYPYLVCGSFPKGNAWFFLTPNGEVKIEGANEIFSLLFPMCNGEIVLEKVIRQVAGKTGIDEEEIRDLAHKLFELDILQDKHQLFLSWKKYGENPMIFWQEISEKEIAGLMKENSHRSEFSLPFSCSIPNFKLRDLLEKRYSTREFSSSGMAVDDVFGLFWATYGRQRNRSKVWKYGIEKTYTVPSGGALFPLILYLILIRKIEDMIMGIYKWESESSRFNFLNSQTQINTKELEEIINGIDSLKNVVGVMAVFADFERVSKKYSNKAYPLVLLEAGHAMQNAYLYCAERNLGFIEILGFNHQKLMNIIGSSKKNQPVTIGVFGNKGGEQ